MMALRGWLREAIITFPATMAQFFRRHAVKAV